MLETLWTHAAKAAASQPLQLSSTSFAAATINSSSHRRARTADPMRSSIGQSHARNRSSNDSDNCNRKSHAVKDSAAIAKAGTSSSGIPTRGNRRQALVSAAPACTDNARRRALARHDASSSSSSSISSPTPASMAATRRISERPADPPHTQTRHRSARNARVIESYVDAVFGRLAPPRAAVETPPATPRDSLRPPPATTDTAALAVQLPKLSRQPIVTSTLTLRASTSFPATSTIATLYASSIQSLDQSASPRVPASRTASTTKPTFPALHASPCLTAAKISSPEQRSSLDGSTDLVHNSASTIAIIESPSDSLLRKNPFTEPDNDFAISIKESSSSAPGAQSVMPICTPSVVRALSDSHQLPIDPHTLDSYLSLTSAATLPTSDASSASLHRPKAVPLFLDPINNISGVTPIAIQPAQLHFLRSESGSKSNTLHMNATHRTRSQSALPSTTQTRTIIHQHHLFQHHVHTSQQRSHSIAPSSEFMPSGTLNSSLSSSNIETRQPKPKTSQKNLQSSVTTNLPDHADAAPTKQKKTIPERIASFFRSTRPASHVQPISSPIVSTARRSPPVYPISSFWAPSLRLGPSDRPGSNEKKERHTSTTINRAGTEQRSNATNRQSSNSRSQHTSQYENTFSTNITKEPHMSNANMSMHQPHWDNTKPPLRPSNRDMHDVGTENSIEVIASKETVTTSARRHSIGDRSNMSNSPPRILDLREILQSSPFSAWKSTSTETYHNRTHTSENILTTKYHASVDGVSATIDGPPQIKASFSQSHERLHVDRNVPSESSQQAIFPLDDMAIDVVPDRLMATPKFKKKFRHLIHLKRSQSETYEAPEVFDHETDAKDQGHFDNHRNQNRHGYLFSHKGQQGQSQDTQSHAAQDLKENHSQRNFSAHTRSQPQDLNRPRSSTAQKRIIETSVIYYKEESGDTTLGQSGEVEQGMGKVNQYHILREIGSGSFGRVVLVRSEDTKRYYACKIISKSRLRKKFRWVNAQSSLNTTPIRTTSSSSSSLVPSTMSHELFMDTIKREVAILKKLSKHPNIVNLVEVLEDGKEDNFYMIFDLCEYGAVMDIQVGQLARPFTEILARKYFRDIVLGIEYLHYKRIIHNDIKPDNLLRTAKDVIQIADFGISHILEEGKSDELLIANNASPLFSAPEASIPQIGTVNGKALDIWSLGVTLYCFVHGRCPWESEDVVQLSRMIVFNDYLLSESISESLKDLIRRMLNKNPRERIQIDDIKAHPWVTVGGTEPMLSTEKNCVDEEVTEEDVENAFRPAMMFVNKIINKFKAGRLKTAKQRPETAAPSKSARTSASTPSHPAPQQHLTASSPLLSSRPLTPQQAAVQNTPMLPRVTAVSTEVRFHQHHHQIGVGYNRTSSDASYSPVLSSLKRTHGLHAAAIPKSPIPWKVCRNSNEFGAVDLENLRQSAATVTDHSNSHNPTSHSRDHTSEFTRLGFNSRAQHPPQSSSIHHEHPLNNINHQSSGQSHNQNAASSRLRNQVARMSANGEGLKIDTSFNLDDTSSAASRGTGPYSEWISLLEYKFHDKDTSPTQSAPVGLPSSSASSLSPIRAQKKPDAVVPATHASASDAAALASIRAAHIHSLSKSRPNVPGPANSRTPRIPHEL